MRVRPFRNILVDCHAADAGIPVSLLAVGRAIRRTRSSPKASWTNWRRRAAKIRWKCGGGCWRNPRACWACSNVAAEKAGWGKPLPAGRSSGVAVVNNIGSFTAQVAEVSVDQAASCRFIAWCARWIAATWSIPAIIAQQIESGIVYGLSAALKGEITIDQGPRAAGQLRHLRRAADRRDAANRRVISSRAITTPAASARRRCRRIAPAVCNAIFAATGKRIRQAADRGGGSGVARANWG